MDLNLPESCDYLVIGGGSGGCVAAARIAAESDAEVLLLESGGTNDRPDIIEPGRWPDLLESDAVWDYRTTPQAGTADRVHHWSMGKALGGSSSVNGMLYMRGAPWDYDDWAAAGNPGWESERVYEIFRRLESYPEGAGAPGRGEDGPLSVIRIEERHPLTAAFLEACAECGYSRATDFNGPDPEGFETNQLNVVDGRRCDAATAFLAPLADRANLRVALGVSASRLVLEPDGRTVREVVVDTGAGERRVRVEREVLVAAGSIGSPRLLLLSGIGPADDLRAIGIEPAIDLAGVGANLQDHIGAPVAYEAVRPFPFSEYQIVEAGLYFRSDESVERYDMQIPFQLFPFSRPGFEGFSYDDGFTLYPGLLKPRSTGRLSLRSADPAESLLIDAGYLTDHDDVERLVKGLRVAREIGSAPAFDGWRKREAEPGPELTDDASLADYVRGSAGTYFHPVGTCRMGPGADCVVDSQLRLHGADNVRVVDSSVMPDLPSGNTNLPTMMIGWQAADFVLASA